MDIDTEDLIAEVEKPKPEEEDDDALVKDLEKTYEKKALAEKQGKKGLNRAKLANLLEVQMAELTKARERSLEDIKNSKEEVGKDHIADLDASYTMLMKYAK